MLHELQRKAIQTIEHYYDLSWEKLRIKLPYPKVSFDLTGTTAGIAYPGRNFIKLNNRFLFNNTEDFLHRTPIHECCHIFAHERFKGKIRPHGDEWQSCMEAYDAPATRCHNYLSENIGQTPITYATADGVVTCNDGLHILKVNL